ncbi:MAG: phosphoglycerate kinase [Acidobacteriota bacterium]|nr:phosphoglycerate kinase [Acidobacteriota bacterium]
MAVKSLDALALNGKRVLMRVDYNVPMDSARKITDDSRIQASLPTVRKILDAGAAHLTLMSHLGRPKGQVKPELSLGPAAEHLSSLLGEEVPLVTEMDGRNVSRVQLLENLRFHPGETKNDEGLAKQLATFGDVYVNDAFGTAHRAHASTAAVAGFFVEKGAGLLMNKELHYLKNSLENPEKPFVAILGGSKISDKLLLVENLLNKVDALLIGGGMSYTFLAAQGIGIGNSLVEHDFLDGAKRLIDLCGEKGVDLLLPLDHLTGAEFKAETDAVITLGQAIEDGQMGLDIGPETINLYAAKINEAKTVVWNGPMGVFEWEPFSTGTIAVAEAMAESKALTIIGGGDSVAAINKAGVRDQMTHISTGGGASLELLGGKDLPGIVALES